MKRKSKTVAGLFLTLSALVLLFANVGWAADEKDQSDIQKRIQNAADVLDEIMAVKDKAIPDEIMENAECVAVVPSMLKIAIGIGGNYRQGVAHCKHASGWGPPAALNHT